MLDTWSIETERELLLVVAKTGETKAIAKKEL